MHPLAIHPECQKRRAWTRHLVAPLWLAFVAPGVLAQAQEPGAPSVPVAPVAAALPAASAPLPASPAPVVAGLTLGNAHFDGQYQLGGRLLLLNGGGVRAKMIIKVYAVALYLPQPAHDAQAVLGSDVPHSFQVVMLRDVEARHMADGFGKAVLDVLPPERHGAVSARVAQLSQAFAQHGDVHRGEVVKLDYLPGQGTRVSVGDQAICPDIPGEDFNVALMSLWLGEHAADERLKQLLLGAQP
jgi:hypothetical protein